jgi:putative Ca2+/H+ antiporter (TMEM165/GDT1 family)
LGYVVLAVAGAMFAATANRWKRVFPGIMLAATLGTLLELEQGHAVNNPSVLIPRWIALVQLVVITGVTVLSFTFKNRRLNILDRIALLAFAASIYVGGEEATRQQLPLALIVGGVCVVAAWAYDRLQRPKAEYSASR